MTDTPARTPGTASPGDLDALTRGLGAGVWSLDHETDRFTQCSSTMAELWGRSIERLLSQPGEWLQSIHPEDRATVAQAVVRARGEASDEPVEVLHRVESGSWLRSRLVPIPDAASRITGWSEPLALDSTQARDLAELQAWHLTPESVDVEYLMSWLAARADVEFTFYSVPTGGPGSARMVCLHGEPNLAGSVYFDARGCPAEAVLAGRPITSVTDICERFPNDVELRHVGAKGYVGVPIAPPGKPVAGMLTAISMRPLPAPHFVQALMCSAASLLEHVVQGESAPGFRVAQALTPQRTPLSRNLERYRAFFETAEESLWCIEPDTPIPLDLPIPERRRRFIESVRFVEGNTAYLGRAPAQRQSWAGRLVAELPRFWLPHNQQLISDLLASGFRPLQRVVEEFDDLQTPRVYRTRLMPVVEDGCFIRCWCASLDQTEQVLSDRRREDSQLQNKAILESTVNGIVILDSLLRIVYVNPKIRNLLQRAPQELLGRHADTLLSSLSRTEIERLFRELLEGADIQRELVLMSSNGDAITTEFSAAYRDVLGGRFYCFLHDITARREAAALAREHERQLAHLTRLNMVGEMASGLAHELNQPLAAIVNYTRGCLRRLPEVDGSEPLRQALSAAADQAQRAGQILRSLRRLVRRGEQERVPCNLGELVEETLPVVRHLLQAHQVELEVQPGLELVELIADPTQVQQVLINLIRNAVEALAEQTTPRQIEVRHAQAPADRWRISLLDSGPGVLRQEDVFSPFVTSKAEGVGLGLSISRSIVESHGGRLWIAAEPGWGGAFHFTLPSYLATTRPE